MKANVNDNSSVVHAIARIQRDFVNTIPIGSAPLALVGDGINFIFMETKVRYNELVTHESKVYTTNELEDLENFLVVLLSVMQHSINYDQGGIFIPVY